MSDVETLVARNDPDGLVRAVDAATARRDWDGLVAIAAACRAAVATGRQLWPIASLAEYRLALRAPGPVAASVVREGTGRFALGPLSEVAASTHTWAELAPGLDGTGPLAAYVAHERIVRGEDLRDGAGIDPRVLEIPLAMASWEPYYALAEYRDDDASFDPPPAPALSPARLPSHEMTIDDDRSAAALTELVAHWARESNGHVEVVSVEGDHLSAIAALGPPSARVAEIEPADAMAWMAWAGANGGAHGRRRGMATGRFGAWWAAGVLAGLDDAWPPHADELGAALAELRWFAWDAFEPPSGWALRLAIWDPADGVAWAIAATDAA